MIADWFDQHKPFGLVLGRTILSIPECAQLVSMLYPWVVVYLLVTTRIVVTFSFTTFSKKEL